MERATYDRMRELQQAHWWFEARRRILAAEIGRLELPPMARILEAGCGPGGNLSMLQRFGRVSAIEPDAPSRAYAAERSGLAVEAGRLPDGLPFAPGTFDLVCAFDVVEHVEDDAAAMRALAAQLAPGGRLLITVPANAWMWSAHDVAHHHKRRYSRRQVRGLIAGAGLTLRRATYFNTLLFPPIAAVRLAKGLLGRKGGDEEALPPPPVNGLLQTVFASEANLLRYLNLPFGVSLLAVGEKPA